MTQISILYAWNKKYQLLQVTAKQDANRVAILQIFVKMLNNKTISQQHTFHIWDTQG